MALTPAQIKAMHTGGVARVLRIRHGGYQVPGSQNGRVSTVLGTDLRVLSGDCPAGRWGLDCSHRAAVAVRCAIEHACSIQSARGGATGAVPGSARSTSPVPIAGRDREDAGARQGVVPRGSAAPASRASRLSVGTPDTAQLSPRRPRNDAVRTKGASP